MEKTSIIYPAIFMMVLTLCLYIKNFIDNMKGVKNKTIKFSFFKNYEGNVPENITVSRQTLKNQFELPILFYFLISLLLIFDSVLLIDLVLAWIFVISRYIHSIIRLTTNYVPHRAKLFQVGLLALIVSWIHFLYNIL